MRAMAITEFGGAGKLRLMDLPVPDPKPDEILIQVKAAGVNPVDWKITEGQLQGRLPHKFPVIPGWDVAGIVCKRGARADLFPEGSEVYAYCRKPVINGGTYAEYVTVSQGSVALKPKALTFEEAATVPLAALTAYQSLFDAAKLEPNETVLIHGAAGGVGSFAVQLARDRGAFVLGTASHRNYAYLRSLGCDEPIDYTSGDLLPKVRHASHGGVDVVFDCAGGGVLAASMALLRRTGRAVSIIDPDEVETLKQSGTHAFYVFGSPSHDDLATLTGLIEEGRLGTRVAARLPLAEAAKALTMSETRHTQGKIVITV